MNFYLRSADVSIRLVPLLMRQILPLILVFLAFVCTIEARWGIGRLALLGRLGWGNNGWGNQGYGGYGRGGFGRGGFGRRGFGGRGFRFGRLFG
ncbi:Neuropeptide-like protein 28 family protein [Oesophagostomum dentatum]|uniref:Neuropeptide-like protein 28 family protein n=1 Tax=Oesophagostomum dentatum TaxID=61180 RepID=A0A0B1TRE1_OESDE|nr:Neuropeptide-like protein 28 family protein [Oesophagostomum dentatum]